jgi:hypothetical protein
MQRLGGSGFYIYSRLDGKPKFIRAKKSGHGVFRGKKPKQRIASFRGFWQSLWTMNFCDFPRSVGLFQWVYVWGFGFVPLLLGV